MWGKIKTELSKLLNIIVLYLPKWWEFIKLWWNKFVNWRIARYQRFKKLVWYKKLANSFVTFIVLFLIFLFLVDINFLWLFGKSPSLFSISHPEQSSASEIISADGKVMGKYYRENRMPVDFNEISPRLIETLIATEDERFYQHLVLIFRVFLPPSRT